MKFLKHVGKHNDRKVAVVFREVPGEPHMCLVVYTELLNRHIHDAVVGCIESDIGQNSENLADALNRMHTKEGKLILPLLHHEGMLKKVQTELITMTPMPNTQIKLSELNNMLDEMKKGEEAVAKLAEMDKSRGLQDPAEVARRMRNDTPLVTESNRSASSLSSAPNGILDDSSIAQSLRKQAEKMTAEAKGLMAESERLLKEASQLDGTLLKEEEAPKITTIKKEKVISTSDSMVKKAGRPKKVSIA